MFTDGSPGCCVHPCRYWRRRTRKNERELSDRRPRKRPKLLVTSARTNFWSLPLLLTFGHFHSYSLGFGAERGRPPGMTEDSPVVRQLAAAANPADLIGRSPKQLAKLAQRLNTAGEITGLGNSTVTVQ
eukprot:1550470-Pyramimonas_sp.AAC.1